MVFTFFKLFLFMTDRHALGFLGTLLIIFGVTVK